MTTPCTHCYCGEPLTSQHRGCPTPEEISRLTSAFRAGEITLKSRAGRPVKGAMRVTGGVLVLSDEAEREYRAGQQQEEELDDA